MAIIPKSRSYLQARNALESGEVILAAQLVLKASDNDHKSMRELRLEIKERVITDTREALQSGLLDQASQLMQTAAQLGELNNDDKNLLEKIKIARRSFEEAEHLKKEGRLKTAIEVLDGAGLEGPGVVVRGEMQRTLQRADRYAKEIQDHLEAEDLPRARESLERLREIAPKDPRVVEVARQLGVEDVALPGYAAPEMPVPPATKVVDPCARLVLQKRTLLTSASVLTIGTQRGVGVMLPIYRLLHGNHALIMRTRNEYLISPVLSSGEPSEVALNEKPIQSMTLLHHGDTICLGGQRSNCSLTFRLPVEGSQTGVLSAQSPESADALPYEQVVLLADHADIRRPGNGSIAAHVLMKDLPCECLRFEWEGTQNALALVVNVIEGEASLMPINSHGEATTIEEDVWQSSLAIVATSEIALRGSPGETVAAYFENRPEIFSLAIDRLYDH